MRAILLFIVAVATVNGENYILGGQEAEPFSIPYIASLQLHLPPNFVHVCGGVILTPRLLKFHRLISSISIISLNFQMDFNSW